MTALARRRPIPRNSFWHGVGGPLILASAAAFALALAFLLVHRGPAAALALVLLPPIAYLLAKSYGGLALGIVMVLILPYWLDLGSAQSSVLRIASAAAAVTLLSARGFRPTVIDFALVIFVGVTVFDWLLQYDQPHVGRIVAIELTPIGFYLGARAITRDRLMFLMSVVLFAGTIGALTVLYEFAHGYSVFINPARYVWNATGTSIFRPGGIFGSPPGASTVLCFVLLFGLAYATVVRGWRKLLVVGCVGVCTLALIVTFTRAGIIAAGVGVLVFLLLMRSRLLRPLRVAWFAVAVAGILVLLLPGLERSTNFQQAILRPGNLPARESYWKLALPLATSTPHNLVLGLGTGVLEAPGTFSSVAVPAEVAANPQLTENSLHSQYVTTLTEQGALGVAALISLLLAALIPCVRAARNTGEAPFAALAASIVALAITMTVDTAVLHGPSFAMFLVAVGLAATGPRRMSDMDVAI
jgi:O-antigen ligase